MEVTPASNIFLSKRRAEKGDLVDDHKKTGFSRFCRFDRTVWAPPHFYGRLDDGDGLPAGVRTRVPGLARRTSLSKRDTFFVDSLNAFLLAGVGVEVNPVTILSDPPDTFVGQHLLVLVI